MRQGGNKLHVVVNGAPILEFDRAQPIPGHQRRYLDNMDARMDQGIQLGEKFISSPDPITRCQFISNSLVNALFAENYSLAMALCTWLADRIPDLQMVKVAGEPDGEMGVELIFDRNYEKVKTEQGIKFYGRKSPGNTIINYFYKLSIDSGQTRKIARMEQGQTQTKISLKSDGTVWESYQPVCLKAPGWI